MTKNLDFNKCNVPDIPAEIENLDNINSQQKFKDAEIKLINLFEQIDVELLLGCVSQYKDFDQTKCPYLLMIFIEYVSLSFQSKGSSVIIENDLKTCISLLKDIYFYKCLLSNESDINNYVLLGVQGFSEKEQSERKLKTFELFNDLFIKKFGLRCDVILKILDFIYNNPFHILNLKKLEQKILNNNICSKIELQTFINKFSVSLNSIKSINKDELRYYPIFKYFDGSISFLCSILHFYDIIWELLQEGIEKYPEFKSFQFKRSKYLEDQLYNLLINFFPKTTIIKKNIKYSSHGEIDCLVVFNDTILIFEAKAGRIYRPVNSERKNRDCFEKKRLDDMFTKGSNQANRFKNMWSVEIAKKLDINYSSIKNIYSCLITLDHLANFGFSTNLLENSNKNNYIPLFFIDDLELIFDKIKKLNTSEKIDIFINFIAEISKKYDKPYVSDILDVFKEYLNFNQLPQKIDDCPTFYQ